MVQVRADIHRPFPQPVLAACGLMLLAQCLAAQQPRFYPDDPVRVMPPPYSAKVTPRNTDALYDFLKQSFQPDTRPPAPALGVNTLGEVPDSEWYTNRHGVRRMTPDELRRGPGDGNPPQAPFRVVGGKVDGITPGFRMVDAKNTLYFVKPDPRTNPEMATAADVIGSRFFYAIGYNTPENYILYLRPEDLAVGEEARIKGLNDKRRPMNRRDLNDILRNVPRRTDGTIRVLASAALKGEPLGPFRYEKFRRDDPNDIVPHDRRRDLRGLHVFCAWLNHTDAKSINSLDVLVEEQGRTFVRHYLIDFGAILGSDSDMPKNARFGNEYVLPKPKQALGRMVAFGFDTKPWETADYGDLKPVGRLESAVFDPEKWKSNYPNPAFLSRLPDDEFWAAKTVMAFTEPEIRAIVEAGQYSNPRAVDYITKTLAERRDKIGRTYFAKVLPLDGFRVEAGSLRFEDLAVKYNFEQPRKHEIAWSAFDNSTGKQSPLAGETSAGVPQIAPGGYLAATITLPGDNRRKVTAFLRHASGGYEVVGLDRTW
ncbi:MAG: hypothetical protein JNL98_09625 [Bryobacterales bacterium]|nr:hypothetical protein [Bryobacterales bacterium]